MSRKEEIQGDCTFDLNFDADADAGDSLGREFSDIEDFQRTFAADQESGDKRIDRKRKMNDEMFGSPTRSNRKSPQKHGRDGAAGESVDGPRAGIKTSKDTQCSREGSCSPICSNSPSRRSCGNSPKKNYCSISDLFEEVGKGTKSFILQLAQSFRESEDYESLCLHNVETMLEEAKVLERSLAEQKDLLQQRLFVIGQRLSNHDL